MAFRFAPQAYCTTASWARSTAPRPRPYGGSFQAATNAKIFGQSNRFVIGASSDNGHVQFDTTSELGTINPDQFPFVQGVGIYINQPSGDVAPVGVLAMTRYTGVYTTDTFDVTSRLAVTFGGRYNVAQIGLRDSLGNNEGRNGDHSYSRFNPVIGTTFKVTPNVTAYAGMRKPTGRRRRSSLAAPIRCGHACSTMPWSAIHR